MKTTVSPLADSAPHLAGFSLLVGQRLLSNLELMLSGPRQPGPPTVRQPTDLEACNPLFVRACNPSFQFAPELVSPCCSFAVQHHPANLSGSFAVQHG